MKSLKVGGHVPHSWRRHWL